MMTKERIVTGRLFGLPRTEGPIRAFVSLVMLWVTRAKTRRILAELDDSILRDIGLSRDDVERELRKPFWQA